MSGLERLRNLKNTEGIEFKTGEPACFVQLPVQTIERIADEIERDMNNAGMVSMAANSMREFADRIEKPFSDDDTMNSWLDRWYLPRPVIDGEPVQFGERIVNNIGQETVATSMFFYSDSDKSSICVNGRYVNEWERIEPDSIEKLRNDLCAEHGCVEGSYCDCDACYDCEVTEWLKRAEKLFKDGDNANRVDR